MVDRIFIENPPPLKSAPGRDGRRIADVPIAEGLEAARIYLDSGLHSAHFHHSDLDAYEAEHRAGKPLPSRYDSFAYAEYLKDELANFDGILIPHRIVVYQTPEQQEAAFRRLADAGIADVVLVGKPFTIPPAGVVYRCTVEDMLAHLTRRIPALHLGVIGIHLRRREPQRIVRKFQAAGGRLRVMGQFLDGAKPMTDFMESLAREFERRALALDRLEWNVGLAIFALKNRSFYAKLLRKNSLDCEDRFRHLKSIDARIDESICMNLEFASRVCEKGQEIGMDVGFSIQPLIERSPNRTVHPSVYGALQLAKKLEQLVE